MLAALTLSSLFAITGAAFVPDEYAYIGEGCDSEALGNLKPVADFKECTVCHFVQNKAPCLNTAENIFKMRFRLFGGKWLKCVEKDQNGLYACEKYAEKHPELRIRNTKDGQGREYYKKGHYDFFQLENEFDKADPIVSGPKGELYCPALPKDRNLVRTIEIGPGQDPTEYGCMFDFARGICFVPKKTPQTMLMKEWERSYKTGNCGPICPVTGRPWFPSKVLLTVCFDMERKACCFPNQDTEIEEFYYDFLTAGDRCKEELIPAKKALRRLFCMACHHDAGKYIVDGTIRICKSLALKITPEKFDKCGVLKAEERGAPWFGDDMVTPSADWGVGLAGALKMLEATGGGDPQDGKLTKAAGMTADGGQGPRVGAFPPFIPEDYKIEIVDNCIMDKYNPYTGETTLCAEISENVTKTCYDLVDSRANAVMMSLITLMVTLVINLSW